MSQIGKLFSTTTPPTPPGRRPKVLKGLGDPRIDDYYWLRDADDQETHNYLEAENTYAHETMQLLEPLRGQIYEEFIGRIELADASVPQRHLKYYYFSKTEDDSQYEIHLRYLDPNQIEVVLDENELAKGHEYFAIGSSALTIDETKVAYGIDLNGSEIFSIYVKNLTTNETIALPMENATYGLEFDNSGNKLFWVEADETMRPYRVNCYDLTNPNQASNIIYTELDESFSVSIAKSKDDKTLIIDSSSTTSSEVHLLDLNSNTPLETVLVRRDNLEYSAEPLGDYIYILSNLNAQNFKISRCARSENTSDAWVDLYPDDPNVKIESFEVFNSHIAIEERREGFLRIRIVDLRNDDTYFIPAEEEGSTLEIDSNPNLNSAVLRYSYTSLLSPRSVREIDLETKAIDILKTSKVQGGYEKADYRCEVVRITSRDGVELPVSLLLRNDLKLDGSNPLLLYGYGSYEHSVDPSFSSIRLSLCNRGVIFAIAHVRGGGELGRSWYLDGKLSKKHNTFNDFIDVARGLIALKYTAPQKIVSWGGSAGGMLVAAALNQDPTLFSGVIAEVPFVDCLTTISDPSLPLTIPEWQEWGNPLDDFEIYNEMLSYSPYDNIQPKVKYPPVFVTAGLNDPRVAFHEPAKWVAKLRATTQDPQVLLWIETGAGHFGASGRFNEWETVSRLYAFALWCLFDNGSKGN